LKYLPSISFWVLGVVWGSNFIYMKMASEYISSMQIVFYRVLFGFIPVLLYALISKSIKIGHFKHSIHFFVMSLLATSVYYYGFVKGSTLLLSGVAGALSGSIPLFAFLLAITFLKDERATPHKILGVVIGFAGVLVIARVFEQGVGGSNFEGVAYMVAGALSVGSSFVYARRFISPLNIPAAALTTYQLGFALVSLLFVTNFDGANAIWANMHTTLGMVLGLGLLGTGLAYIIYYYIVETLGAVTASSATYIPPVVALFIGAFIVGEHIELIDYVSTLIIFAGVFLIKKAR